MLRIDEMKVVEKLRKTKTSTDVRAVLKMMRQMVDCENLTYEEMLARCLHTEDIVSIADPVYPIFKEDLAALLEGKTEDDCIIILTEIRIMLL